MVTTEKAAQLSAEDIDGASCRIVMDSGGSDAPDRND
jgi:hypothetical protein